MPSFSKKKVGYFVGTAFAVFITYFFIVGPPWSFVVADYYRRALPIQLETVDGPITGSDLDLMTALAPLRHEACGGALFHLTEATLDLIQKNGLSFFDNAVQGRGYPDGHQKSYFYRYAAWQETPATENMRKNSAWVGLVCMKLGNEMERKIEQAANEPGSYFTTVHEAVLLVVPRLGFVVLLYFG